MARPRVLINALAIAGGGGQSHLVHLLREFARDDRGFEITLLALQGQMGEIDPHGFPVREVRLPSVAPVLWRVAYEEIVMPTIARHFDLLYCLGDLAPRYCAAPTVVLLANLNIYDHRWYDTARTRALKRLVRFGLPGANRVVAPTRAAADAIGELISLPMERLRVVPFGFDASTLSDGKRGGGSSVPYVFLPASPERHKNIEVLIDALEHQPDPELELWVAGRSGPDPGHQAVLEQRATARGVGHRVRFLGPIRYGDLATYYQNAYAFAFPSWIETFGFPLLEAMALGTPALASDIPVFHEIAGDAALYFDPRDPVAVGHALAAIAEDPEAAAQRAALGVQRAQRFTWRACVDGLAEVFREALQESR